MDDDATLERDRDQSVLERAKEAVANAVTHGEDEGTGLGAGNDIQANRSGGDPPPNAGNFGTRQQVESDNAAVRNAAQGLDDEALAEGPANTAPDLAQGSM